jgi:hypothetical protein
MQPGLEKALKERDSLMEMGLGMESELDLALDLGTDLALVLESELESG